jgi:N-acyl amino acid synthase of PEP-CTERM/exosortase system
MFLSNLTELTMSQGYRRFFKVVPAVSDELRAENYRIRHEVYCRELGFEALRPDCLEADEFDRQSVHCLVQSVASGAYVGCARLVLADPDSPLTPLPFEVTCEATLDRSIVDPMRLDRSRIAEISRLAVVGSYRRRKGEQDSPLTISEEDFGTPRQPRQPYLALAVYLGLIALKGINMTSTVTLAGKPFQVVGDFPQKGQTAPAFTLVGKDLADRSLSSFCRPAQGPQHLSEHRHADLCHVGAQVQPAGERAGQYGGALHFGRPALRAEPLLRCRRSGQGVTLVHHAWSRVPRRLWRLALSNGPLAGLAARAVIVLDADDRVLHSQLVAEIKDEPDYDAALQALA